MLQWLSVNIGTILVAALLLAVIVLIIKILRNDKKNGKSCCGGNCGHCAMGGCCHQKKDTNTKNG